MSLSASLAPQVSPTELGPRTAAHLLNRLGFGPRPGDIGRILKQGLTRYVEEQLEAPPDPELDSRLRALPTLSYPLSQVAGLYLADQGSVGRILEEFFLAKMVRAVHAENQLEEVLVDFWFNHFNVFVADGYARAATPSYERDAIRPHVLGRFRELLGATAAHPAMLFYLDNYLSTVSRMDRSGRLIQGLNENYGRELMELHTVGVDAGYTQDHVFDSARCFTGWGIDFRNGGGFVYRQQNHDTGAKTVMSLNLPAGGGRDDGEKLLDYLSTHPATAHHVSWQLAQRFVADVPPPRLVDRAADTFLRTGGDLREVMRTLIGSAEFWAEAFGTGKPKTPVEFTASCLRAVDAEMMTNVPSRGAGGPANDPRNVLGAVNGMGMPPYFCVPPTGYSNKGGDWLNPSSQLARMNFALDLAAGVVVGVGTDLPGLIRRLGGNADDPQSVASLVSSEIFGKGLSAQTQQAASQVARGGPVSVVARVVGLILAGPEMQVR